MITNLGYMVDYIIDGKWKNMQGIICLVPPANGIEEIDGDFFFDKIAKDVGNGLTRENTPIICFITNWKGSLEDLENFAQRKSTDYMGDMNILKIINENLLMSYLKDERGGVYQ